MITIIDAAQFDAYIRPSGPDIAAEDELYRRVQAIISGVRNGGDQALIAYTEQFDGVRPQALRVAQNQTVTAWQNTDVSLRRALRAAAARIEAFHRHQLTESWTFTGDYGEVLGQRVRPIARVAIYVPGGTAVYPSSVLMNAIPAQVAGVEEIVLVSPPQPDGQIASNILAAAHLLGITEIYAIGGAQAIAALAYGTASIPAVDKIVGPGNQYVAKAKQLVFGQVGIDMIAGPSEICILADQTANASWLAADLLSQAEHDAAARAVLVTDSAVLASAVKRAIAEQVGQLSRAAIARQSIADNGLIVLVDQLADQGVAIVNALAPEHLEVVTADNARYIDAIGSAGAIFDGRYATEPLGDYMAGPNHTLPTAGTARFSSPLGVYDFVKRTSYLNINQAAFKALATDSELLAISEGLTAHANAITIRRDDHA